MNKHTYFILLFIVSCPMFVFGQLTIKGVVKDALGSLPGATVQIKGKTIGTTSDADGNFELNVASSDVLLVSYVGYLTQEIPVDGQLFINIVLEEDVNQLDEVVLIGYGLVKKSDLTGSVVSLKSEDLLNTVVSSIDQGIQGKAAGVVVSFNSGQPGSGSSIRIRGIGSIEGTLEPLYVIDGVPINTPSGIGATTGPTISPLETINPKDVESIEILKDASATAIYGARGANGVILITTKRGKAGEATVNVGYTYSIQQLGRKLPLLNAMQLAELGNEAADNAGVDRRTIYASPINLGVGTDWQDEIFRDAPMQDMNISVRGGSENTRYSLSGSILQQDGIILNSDFEKANLRLSLDQNMGDKFEIGSSVNLNRTRLNGVVTNAESALPSSVTSLALIFNPGLSVFDNSHTSGYTFQNNTSNPGVGNPVADALLSDQLTTSSRILANVFVNWKILESLSFKTSVSGDFYFNKEQSFIPNNILRGQQANGLAAIGNSEGYTWLFENTLTYNQIFGDHSINAVVGHSVQKYVNELSFVAASDFDDNRLGYNAIQQGAQATLLFSAQDERQLQSFLGRVNYVYKNKYLATVSARVDGSSVFGAGNKYGVFPSMAFAWKAHEESFLNEIDYLSQLKFRIGYGRVGNEGINPYESLGTLITTEAYFGENNIAVGSGLNNLENAKLKWETTDQFDVGFDLGLFHNRLNVVVDYYYKKTKDLLLNSPVPYTSGFSNLYLNVGNLENSGFEFSVNSVNISTQVINWKTNFNIGFNNNKITKLANQELFANPLLGVNGWGVIRVNESIGDFYGYQSDGIIQTGEVLSQIPQFSNYAHQAGDRKYKDQDGNGILDEADKVKLGNANPDFTFGLGNTFSYKNWLLSIFLQGVYGNEIANFNKFGLESFSGLGNNSTAALERWTINNPTNDYPRANATPRLTNTFSDVQVEDGSYVKLRDITIGYNFPKNWLSKLHLASAKIFVTGKNLWVLTNYSGYDPEVSRFGGNALSLGADYGTYPTSKVYTLGLNLNF